MPARAGGHGDQPVHARQRRLFSVVDIRHVVQHDAPVAMHLLDDGGNRAKRCDDDRDLVLYAEIQIGLQPDV